MKTLEQRLAECNTTAEMSEVYKTYLASAGVIERERGSNAVRVISEPKTVVRTVTQPEDTSVLLQRAVRLPDGKIQLITAYSTSGLDQLEAALLGHH